MAARGTGSLFALRLIAAFEAFKGFTAIAAGLGFLGLLHHDLHRLAASLIGHVGLDPGGHYPALVLGDIDRLREAGAKPVVLAALAYAAVRLAEAYGLWKDLAWAQWLGTLSGALYVPFEARHMVHRPTVATAVVIFLNVAIVATLAWRLGHIPPALRH